MNEPIIPQQTAGSPAGSTENIASVEPSALSTSPGFLERIKHHKVVQWTLAYAALAYTLLHGAEMLGSSLG